MMATQRFCVIRRCATVAAVVGCDVASAMMSLSFAPPRALMPPAALISSAASSSPWRELMPNWALAPDSGKITPTLTSDAAASARPGRLAAKAAAPRPVTNSLRPRRIACWGVFMVVSWLFSRMALGSQPGALGQLLFVVFNRSRILSDNLTIDDSAIFAGQSDKITARNLILAGHRHKEEQPWQTSNPKPRPCSTKA
ncbi:hypothetical protein D9M68_637800 [compost metagenome]